MWVCVWLFHRQTNKLNNYSNLINLICEFVCWQDKQKKKQEKKPTNGSVYRVAAQLKNMMTHNATKNNYRNERHTGAGSKINK